MRVRFLGRKPVSESEEEGECEDEGGESLHFNVDLMGGGGLRRIVLWLCGYRGVEVGVKACGMVRGGR